MSAEQPLDLYEVLQISPNADPDTIHRVFRLLAQRFHPDNQQTGDGERFRQLQEAYSTLSEPERRAQYDVKHATIRKDRWRFVAVGPPAENDFDIEQEARCSVLEILYSRRRNEPETAALSAWELSELLARPREHLEFTMWYLTQRKMITRDDQSKLQITVEGVDYIEQRGRRSTPRLQAPR